MIKFASQNYGLIFIYSRENHLSTRVINKLTTHLKNSTDGLFVILQPVELIKNFLHFQMHDLCYNLPNLYTVDLKKVFVYCKMVHFGRIVYKKYVIFNVNCYCRRIVTVLGTLFWKT